MSVTVTATTHPGCRGQGIAQIELYGSPDTATRERWEEESKTSTLPTSKEGWHEFCCSS